MNANINNNHEKTEMRDNIYFELENLVRKLRKECPWDREQTNDSIKSATIEEAYEVVEAIDNKDYDELKKELGDLLLHVLFHSIIAEDEGKFTINEVIEHLMDKLIRRHPHIFGEKVVNNKEEVKANWEMIKLEEGRESIIDGIPKNLPSLLYAHRLQEKAAKIGFEWNDSKDAFRKVEEEIIEIKNEIDSLSNEKLADEIGDLLFALANFSRMMNINSEEAIRRANNKFSVRFKFVEERINQVKAEGKEINLDKMLEFWAESKKIFV